MPHPAMSPNHVAVVTGGASGIGLAAAIALRAPRHEGLYRRSRSRPSRRGRSETVGGSARGRGQHPGIVDGCQSRRGCLRPGNRGSKAVRRHRHSDEQCRHPAGQPDVRPGGKLAAHPRRQSLGRDPRLAGLCARHDRARPAGPHHQHRLEAGHHHAARRSRLQRLQGRRESLHRSAAARIAQHRRQPAQRASV